MNDLRRVCFIRFRRFIHFWPIYPLFLRAAVAFLVAFLVSLRNAIADSALITIHISSSSSDHRFPTPYRVRLESRICQLTAVLYTRGHGLHHRVSYSSAPPGESAL